MASRRPYDSQIKSWSARVTIDMQTHWLGSFETRREAELTEARFRNDLRTITHQAHELWRAQFDGTFKPLPEKKEVTNAW